MAEGQVILAADDCKCLCRRLTDMQSRLLVLYDLALFQDGAGVAPTNGAQTGVASVLKGCCEDIRDVRSALGEDVEDACF